MARVQVVVLAVSVAAGCNFAVADPSEVPTRTSYARDVAPILNDHCNLCHGQGGGHRGAPSDFSLDDYGGARYKMVQSLRRIEQKQMPPAAAWGDGLGPNATKILTQWVAEEFPR